MKIVHYNIPSKCSKIYELICGIHHRFWTEKLLQPLVCTVINDENHLTRNSLSSWNLIYRIILFFSHQYTKKVKSCGKYAPHMTGKIHPKCLGISSFWFILTLLWDISLEFFQIFQRRWSHFDPFEYSRTRA